MRLLIIGGAGFIGSYVVDQCAASGDDVTVFGRSPEKYRAPRPDVEYITGDIDEAGRISRLSRDVDAVIHLASATVPSTSAADPVFDIQKNLISTVRMLEGITSESGARLIFASSGGAIYGNPRSSPTAESCPTNPISSYGVVKLAIERYIDTFSISRGLRSVILRPSNPFGPRQGHLGVQGLVATALDCALKGTPITIYGDGSTVRDYIYVADLADLIVRAIHSDEVGTFNCGSGVGLSITEVLDIVEKVTGAPVKRCHKQMRGFDVRRIVLDCAHAEQTFEWRASTPFSNAVEKHWEWLLSLVKTEGLSTLNADIWATL